MANRFTAAAKKAADLTNKQLADELAVVSKLSREKINELLPMKKDKEAFVALMKEVESDTDMDEKLAYLGENAKKVGGVIFKLLKVLV